MFSFHFFFKSKIQTKKLVPPPQVESNKTGGLISNVKTLHQLFKVYINCSTAFPLDLNFPGWHERCTRSLLVKSLFLHRSGFHHPVFKSLNTTVNISMQHQLTIVFAKD